MSLLDFKGLARVWHRDFIDNPLRKTVTTTLCQFQNTNSALNTWGPIGTSVRKTENTYGTVAGRTPAGPFSNARVTTDDGHGEIRAYVSDGAFVDDSLDTFRSRAVVEVPNLQSLLKYICKNGFEHHAAMRAALSSEIHSETFEMDFGWNVYRHQ